MQQPSEVASFSQAVEFVAKSRLAKDRSPDQVQGLIRKVDVLLDAKILEIQKSPSEIEPPACTPGCSHCCHRVVFSTVLEAIVAARHLATALTESERSRLQERFGSYLEVVAPMQGQGLGSVRVACPFLEDGLCSIYDARPLSCRSQFSSQVSDCEKASHEPDCAFPASPDEWRLGRAATASLQTSLNSSGLWDKQVDFARTVALTLAEPALAEQYLSGVSMFQIAAVQGLEQTPNHLVDEKGYGQYSDGEEATGMGNNADLALQRFLLFSKGDADGAFEKLSTDGPLQQMFRIQVPMAYGSADEIQYRRQEMVRAFEEFSNSPADLRDKFDAIVAYNPLSLSYQQVDDRELLSQIGDYLTHKVTAKVFPEFVQPILKRKQSGKLRVGYIGMDLGFGSSAYWATGWLKNHSKDVETHVFHLNPQLTAGAEIYKRHAFRFYHCTGPVPPIARLIKSLNLDVLIYPDISCEGRNAQLATMRLAPVQCVGWGNPETSGMPFIDYFLSADWMEPENADDHYRETLVRLPKTGVCFPSPARRGAGRSKAAFGLDDGPLLLCTQSPSKILPPWDWLFKEICDRTGRPIVFFSYEHSGSPVVERRLKRAGVNAIFMPYVHMNHFYDLIDLAEVTLDTVGWSGGITTLMALQQRRPVITLPGEFRRGRHAMAFLKAANVPGLVASSPEEYLDLVLDKDRRAEAMRGIEPDALFDDVASVGALESFMRSVAWT